MHFSTTFIRLLIVCNGAVDVLVNLKWRASNAIYLYSGYLSMLYY